LTTDKSSEYHSGSRPARETDRSPGYFEQHVADPNTKWTHLGSFYINGAPYIISYDKNTGVVFFDQIGANGSIAHTVWSGNMGAGWTHLMAFTDAKNEPGFMVYNRLTGAVRFNLINAFAQGYKTTYSGTFWMGWTNFVHSAVNSQFIAYNAITGEVHFAVMKDDATGYTIQSQGYWTKNVSLLSPFKFYVSVDIGAKQAIGGFVPYTSSNGDVRVWLF
jgi:hypothetical protein